MDAGGGPDGPAALAGGGSPQVRLPEKLKPPNGVL